MEVLMVHFKTVDADEHINCKTIPQSGRIGKFFNPTFNEAGEDTIKKPQVFFTRTHIRKNSFFQNDATLILKYFRQRQYNEILCEY